MFNLGRHFISFHIYLCYSVLTGVIAHLFTLLSITHFLTFCLEHISILNERSARHTHVQTAKMFLITQQWQQDNRTAGFRLMFQSCFWSAYPTSYPTLHVCQCISLVRYFDQQHGFIRLKCLLEAFYSNTIKLSVVII